MDNENIQELHAMKPNMECRAKIELLGSYDPSKEVIIRDPYYVCCVYILAKCLSRIRRDTGILFCSSCRIVEARDFRKLTSSV